MCNLIIKLSHRNLLLSLLGNARKISSPIPGTRSVPGIGELIFRAFLIKIKRHPYIFQLTLCWIQLVLCRDVETHGNASPSRERVIIFLFLICKELKVLSSLGDAWRRIAMRRYKQKLNHNFGKVLTIYQRI